MRDGLDYRSALARVKKYAPSRGVGPRGFGPLRTPADAAASGLPDRARRRARREGQKTLDTRGPRQ